MPHLFQMEMESVRLSWLQQKSTLSLHRDHHQTSFSRPALLQHQHFSSSPIFCLSSNTQPDSRTSGTKRYARAINRDTQLRKDLQLFLSSQGLPLDKVPSTKELSNRGREDLAKSVRRRGYKAIQALLADSDPKPSTAHVSNTVRNVEDSVREAPVRDPEPSNAHVVGNAEDSVRDTPETILLAASPIDEQLLTKSGTPTDTGQVVESSLGEDSTVLQQGIKSETALKTTIFSNGSLIAEENLRMRAAEFVRTGRLDRVPDSDEEGEDDGDDDDNDDEFLEDSSDEEENVGIQDGPTIAEDIAVEKAAKLRAKLLPFLKSNSSGQPQDQVAESIFDSLQKREVSEVDEASTRIGSGSTLETDTELQKIKSALISKEKELSEVSRDLEETKAQLALVQAKAMAEVAQAKQLALEKDIRLKSADFVLANLKRVQVEYWGEGGRVELAGSFNGWKYFISMEPDPTSEIIKPDGSRGPMMWETELWLYPGVYEIKFIVDGNWQIDQRREIVMRNSLHNNLLRVEP